MSNPDQSLEAAIVAAGANVGPRITLADIEENINDEVYFTAQHGVINSLTKHHSSQSHTGYAYARNTSSRTHWTPAVCS
ncbi:hypothetical protein [Sphaerotilus sp.]|uniref:hypothetical protein n=1 Tax=Sphaerotilus sp. TaxID=2093942 RepID=UPI00286DECAF|nr:hypothetical protein [Sphaerotilus sp.]